MNSTYHSAIKAILYKVVFNFKPNYKRVDPSLQPIISDDEIEEDVVDDEQDNALIRDKQRQLKAETCLREDINIDEEDIKGTIASSGLTNLGPDKTMNEYAGCLPEDHINLESISQYLDSVGDYEDDARSERLPVTPPEFHLNPDF